MYGAEANLLSLCSLFSNMTPLIFFTIFFSFSINFLNFSATFFLGKTGQIFLLQFCLYFLEICSFFIRAFSLSLRLFCNFVAGHILGGLGLGFFFFLGVFLGFFWVFGGFGGWVCFFGLEIFFGILQGGLFLILFFIYLK